MTDSQLTMPEIAARLGVKLSTVQAYRSRGQMPAPSGWLGRTPWWRPEDIDAWIQQRKVK